MNEDWLELRGHVFGQYEGTSIMYECKRCGLKHCPKTLSLGQEEPLNTCDGPEYVEPVEPVIRKPRKPKYELTVI